MADVEDFAANAPLGRRQLRWYRFPDQILFSTGTPCMFLALFGALLAWQGLTRYGIGPAEVAVGALLGVAAAWGLVSGFRSGIGVGRGGVTVRSVLGRSRRVPWQDVAAFQVVRPRLRGEAASQGTVAVAVTCRDGQTLTTGGCYFLRWTNKSGNKKVVQMLRALEAERAAAGQEPPGPSAPDLVP